MCVCTCVWLHVCVAARVCVHVRVFLPGEEGVPCFCLRLGPVLVLWQEGSARAQAPVWLGCVHQVQLKHVLWVRVMCTCVWPNQCPLSSAAPTGHLTHTCICQWLSAGCAARAGSLCPPWGALVEPELCWSCGGGEPRSSPAKDQGRWQGEAGSWPGRRFTSPLLPGDNPGWGTEGIGRLE